MGGGAGGGGGVVTSLLPGAPSTDEPCCGCAQRDFRGGWTGWRSLAPIFSYI